MTELRASPAPRPLGRTGILVSPIAWGMWRFGHAGAVEGRRLVEAALAAGITLFDTADIYGRFGIEGVDAFGDAEATLGEVFAAAPELRDRMVLATKGGITPPVPYDTGAPYLMRALEASLRRLRVQRVDLYQIHRPDILTHPQEVARTLEDMVASGKVRSIGVSNHTRHQTTALQSFLTVPLASLQPEFSPLAIDPMTDGLFDLAMERDLAVLAWSPLGGGRIASPGSAEERAVAAALDRKAQDSGVDRAAAALSWIMAHPARVIPIIGTQDPGRIAASADAFKPGWSRAEWYEVLVAVRGEPLP